MKKLLSLLLALVLVFSLCACGAQESAPEAAVEGYRGNGFSEEELAFDAAQSPAESAPMSQPNNAGPQAPEIDPEKIIYTSEISLETTEFEESIEKLLSLVEEYGGYVEQSSMNDADYYSKLSGYGGLRSASYTLRIPCRSFEDMQGSLSALGNVPYSRTYTENVSAQYYDTEARLRAYTAQEERLIEMLELAESIEDVLAIEGQLTQVRYEIESLQGSLNSWDRRISYSTIYLDISEVSEYTDSPAPSLSYPQRLLRALKDGLYGVGRFFQNLLLWLAGALPALVLLAAAFFVLRPAFKKLRVKRKAKKEEKLKNKDK